MPAINNDTFNDHFFDRAFFIGQIIISEFLGRVLAVAAINDDFVNDHFFISHIFIEDLFLPNYNF